MGEGGLLQALGEGWLGKLIAGLAALVLGSLAGWFSRRPLEKAGILEAVNKRIESYMRHLEGEVRRVTALHNRCEKRLDLAESEARRAASEAELLRGEVRQLKQMMDSKDRISDAR